MPLLFKFVWAHLDALIYFFYELNGTGELGQIKIDSSVVPIHFMKENLHETTGQGEYSLLC